MTDVTVPARCCGPPTSGNGGYTAGLLAAFVDGPTQVTLRRPPPLDTPLAVVPVDDRWELHHGATVVAEARPAIVELDAPAPVLLADAVVASEESWFRDRARHPFPSCFVCGPDRAPGDGLRIFPGPVDGRFAAPWTPTESSPELVWAALDCPSSAPGFALDTRAGALVLGRIAARVDRLPRPGVPHVVSSWSLGEDGRKSHAGSAIHGPDGELCAVARATWIELAG
jgi:hypothetical protein